MKTKREKSLHILHSRNILLEKNIHFLMIPNEEKGGSGLQVPVLEMMNE
jgi:hypothetical protein